MNDIPVSNPDNTGAASASSNTSAVLLKGEIEIFPGQPLPHLNQGPVKAFAAKGRNNEKAFALLCEKNLIPQLFTTAKYATIKNTYIPKLIASGSVKWTSQEQRYVFVYENKLGKALNDHSNKIMAFGLRPDLVMSTAVRNLVPVLKEMRDADCVHGHIRADNLFIGEGEGLNKLMLGECLACPPGYLYTAVYEPIERGLADPIGRGLPGYQDDLYSFGAMLAILMRNTNPLEGMTDEEIVEFKIEKGSYAALTGKERFTGSILELLRGILTDDQRQRWTIDDVLLWLDGQRVTPKQASPQKAKAARPLDFAGEKYLKPQLLALQLHKNPPATLNLIESGELKLWVNRSVQDKALEDRLDSGIDASREQGTSGSGYADRLTAFTSIALAPNMPIIYRDLKFLPGAFGRMLVDAIVMKKNIGTYVEAIYSSLASFWVNTHDYSTADINDHITKFEACRAFLRQAVLGYGIERCIYFMSQETPCLSEKLKDYYVRTPEDLLLAYEDLASKNKRLENFMDRHIIAFLSVRDRAIIDPYIPDINSGEKHRVNLAILKISSAIQKRAKIQDLPHLSAWIADTLESVIERFHNREHRQKLVAQVQKTRDSGDLSKLETLINNPQTVYEDQRQFFEALQIYDQLRREHSALEQRLSTDQNFGVMEGRKAAAFVSGMISFIAIVGYIFLNYSSSIFNLR